MARKLTPKEVRFVAEYLIDLNGTQAAIRSGYSAKTARQLASRLLSKAYIQEAIAEGRKRLEEEAGITAVRVLKEYGRLAFLDIRKAFDENGNLRPIHELDDDTAAAVSGIEFEDVFEGYGRDREKVGTLRKVKLSDKKGALDSIARHLGMFTDKAEISGPGGGPIKTESTGVVANLNADLQSKSVEELTRLFTEKLKG